MIAEHGEVDCINFDLLREDHIASFLKHICQVLQQANEKFQLYHANLNIKNIIFADNQMKLFGFKPRFTHEGIIII